MKLASMALGMVCLLTTDAYGDLFRVRIVAIVNGQQRIGNITVPTNLPVTLQMQASFTMPIDAFDLQLRLSGGGPVPFNCVTQLAPEILAFSPEYQRISLPCANGLRFLRAVMIVDTQEPFESRTILPSGAGVFMPLLNLTQSFNGDANLFTEYNGGEFTVSGGTPVFADVDPGVVSITIVGFIRGDVNGDHRLSISDAVRLLYYLFVSQETYGFACEDYGDANDDGAVDISDPLRIIFVLFGDQQMPAPYPNQGGDPTPDSLTCKF